LLLLFPAMAKLDVADLVAQAGYPATSAISAWQSIGTLLLPSAPARPALTTSTPSPTTPASRSVCR
jgi:hypothetical protein